MCSCVLIHFEIGSSTIMWRYMFRVLYFYAVVRKTLSLLAGMYAMEF